MNANRLLIAVVVLAGLSVAVVMTTRSREASTEVEKPQVALPTIKKDDVTALEIIKPDKVTIALTKENGNWTLTAPLAAAADKTAVDSALDKLEGLEVTSTAATRKENHKKLQVDEGSAIRVKVKASDKLLADLYVGASKSGGTMVRVEGKDEVLAVRGSLRFAFDKEVKQFRDRVITDIETEQLSSMVIESAKGTFKFDKPAETWQPAAGQPAIKEFADSKVQSLASTLARLRAADFAEADEAPEAMGFTTPLSKVTLTTKAGAQTVLELGKEHAGGSEYYLRVSSKPVVYRISKFTGERMMPEAKSFAEEEKSKDEAAPAEGMPMAEGQGIPPALLQQLQQQAGAGHGH